MKVAIRVLHLGYFYHKSGFVKKIQNKCVLFWKTLGATTSRYWLGLTTNKKNFTGYPTPTFPLEQYDQEKFNIINI